MERLEIPAEMRQGEGCRAVSERREQENTVQTMCTVYYQERGCSIAETWLNELTENSLGTVDGFQLVRADSLCSGRLT